MPIKKEILDDLLAASAGTDPFGKDGLFEELKRALSERARKGEPRQTDDEGIVIDFPLDRSGPFDAQLVSKYERIFPGFENRIEAMYGRGMSVRDIQDQLLALYSVDISPELIAAIMDALTAETVQWRSRALQSLYAMVFFDTLRVTVRDRGVVCGKSIHIALGVQSDGSKDILAFWIEPADCRDFWKRAMTEFRGRGVSDILIAIADGETAEAVREAFPRAMVRTSIMQMVEQSVDQVPAGYKSTVVKALKAIGAADDADSGLAMLDTFAGSEWGLRYPSVAAYWRRNWDKASAIYVFPDAIRAILCTTNALESMNAKLRRRAVKTRGHFASVEAAVTQLILLLRHTGSAWKVSPKKWMAAKPQLAQLFAERFPQV